MPSRRRLTGRCPVAGDTCGVRAARSRRECVAGASMRRTSSRTIAHGQQGASPVRPHHRRCCACPVSKRTVRALRCCTSRSPLAGLATSSLEPAGEKRHAGVRHIGDRGYGGNCPRRRACHSLRNDQPTKDTETRTPGAPGLQAMARGQRSMLAVSRRIGGPGRGRPDGRLRRVHRW